MICWFNPKGLTANGKYIIRHTTNSIKGIVKEIQYKVNIGTLEKVNVQDGIIRMNDIARISLRTAQPLTYDYYKENRHTGSFILIDEFTNETVAGGMIVKEEK